MSNKSLLTTEKLYNCFLDLQRGAVSFYLNPQGKTHLIFLKHARKILNKIGNKRAKDISTKIYRLEKEVSSPPQDKKRIIHLADDLLTLGIFLKEAKKPPPRWPKRTLRGVNG